MCGVWVALEDIGPTQGPLMYYTGSHKWPIYANEHIGLCRAGDPNPPSQAAFEPLWRELVRVNRTEPTQFHARQGQALIWTANLLHGGSRQTDPGLTRWSQVTHYYFDGCAYYTPMDSDPICGRIFYRRPENISTGADMPNMYAGRRIPPAYVWAMRLRCISMRRGWNSVRRRVVRRIFGSESRPSR
jgi:hypothetical protein